MNGIDKYRLAKPRVTDPLPIPSVQRMVCVTSPRFTRMSISIGDLSLDAWYFNGVELVGSETFALGPSPTCSQSLLGSSKKKSPFSRSRLSPSLFLSLSLYFPFYPSIIFIIIILDYRSIGLLAFYISDLCLSSSHSEAPKYFKANKKIFFMLPFDIFFQYQYK